MDLFNGLTSGINLEDYIAAAEAGVLDGENPMPAGFFQKRITFSVGVDPTRYHGVVMANSGKVTLNTSKNAIMTALNSEINQARRINLNDFAQVFFNIAHRKGLIQNPITVSSETYRTRVSPFVRHSYSSSAELVRNSGPGTFPENPMDFLLPKVQEFIKNGSKYKKPQSYIAMLQQPLDVSETTGERWQRFYNSFESAIEKNDADGDKTNVLRLLERVKGGLEAEGVDLGKKWQLNVDGSLEEVVGRSSFLRFRKVMDKFVELGNLINKNPVIANPRFAKSYQAQFGELFPLDTSNWWFDESLQKDALKDLSTYSTNKSYAKSFKALESRVQSSNVGWIVSSTNALELYQVQQLKQQYPSIHTRDFIDLIMGSGHLMNKENSAAMGAGKKYLGPVSNYLETISIKPPVESKIRNMSNIFNPDKTEFKYEYRFDAVSGEDGYILLDKKEVNKAVRSYRDNIIHGGNKKYSPYDTDLTHLVEDNPLWLESSQKKLYHRNYVRATLDRQPEKLTDHIINGVSNGSYWDRVKFYNSADPVDVLPKEFPGPPSFPRELVPWIEENKILGGRMDAAKKLLKNMGLEFTEVALSGEHAAWAESRGVKSVGYIMGKSMRIIEQAEEGGVKGTNISGLPIMGQLENRTVLNETLYSGTTKFLAPMYQVEKGQLVKALDPVEQLAHLVSKHTIQDKVGGVRMFGQVSDGSRGMLVGALRDGLDSPAMMELRAQGIEDKVLQDYTQRYNKLSSEVVKAEASRDFKLKGQAKKALDGVLSQFQYLKDSTLHASKHLALKKEMEGFLGEYSTNVRAKYDFNGRGGMAGTFTPQLSHQDLDSVGRMAWVVSNTNGQMGFANDASAISGFAPFSGYAMMGTKPRDFGKGLKLTFASPEQLHTNPNRVNQLQGQMLDSVKADLDVVMVDINAQGVHDLYKRTSTLGSMPEFAEKNPGESIAFLSQKGRESFRGATDQYHMIPGTTSGAGTDFGIGYTTDGVDVVPIMGAQEHLNKTLAEPKIVSGWGERITSTNVMGITSKGGEEFGMAITKGEALSKNTLIGHWIRALKHYGHDIEGLSDYSPQSLASFAKRLEDPEHWKQFVGQVDQKLGVDLEINGVKTRGLKLGKQSMGLWFEGGAPGRNTDPITRGSTTDMAAQNLYTAAKHAIPGIDAETFTDLHTEALEAYIKGSGKDRDLVQAAIDMADYLSSSAAKEDFIAPSIAKEAEAFTAQMLDASSGELLGEALVPGNSVGFKNKKVLNMMASSAKLATKAMLELHFNFLRGK